MIQIQGHLLGDLQETLQDLRPLTVEDHLLGLWLNLIQLLHAEEYHILDCTEVPRLRTLDLKWYILNMGFDIYQTIKIYSSITTKYTSSKQVTQFGCINNSK